jgi:hypothetical protein
MLTGTEIWMHIPYGHFMHIYTSCTVPYLVVSDTKVTDLNMHKFKFKI